MGWQDFVGKAFDRHDFEAYVHGLSWSPRVWCPEAPQLPRGIVDHNTGAPTLKQWAEAGPNHDARIRNLKSFYQNEQHWQGGPHLFVSRNWINVFDGLLEHGTHSPSFNRTHFGVEMVGDFEVEDFNSGDGAMVRDNAVFAMAVLCRAFGWNSSVIILHKEDPATTHKDCPGKTVVKADLLARVQAEIDRMKGLEPQASLPLQKPVAPVSAPTVNRGITATVFGGHVDPGELSAYTGRVIDDVVLGVALPARLVGNRPKVRVFNGSRSAVAEIVDVGPWNTTDAYWEAGKRPQSEIGVDLRGRRTNKAGIDLTPALAKAIGINGLGVVDWEFVPAA